MLTCFTNDATVSIVVFIGHSLSVWWFFESLYTKIFSKPPVVIKVELFSVFIKITECCAIMMWCYDLVLEKQSLICVSTRHFYLCMAKKRKKMLVQAKKNLCTIFTLSYFSISFVFASFFSVPVDLMFITMSWIFFSLQQRKTEKDVEEKRIIEKKTKISVERKKTKRYCT